DSEWGEPFQAICGVGGIGRLTGLRQAKNPAGVHACVLKPDQRGPPRTSGKPPHIARMTGGRRDGIEHTRTARVANKFDHGTAEQRVPEPVSNMPGHQAWRAPSVHAADPVRSFRPDAHGEQGALASRGHAGQPRDGRTRWRWRPAPDDGARLRGHDGAQLPAGVGLDHHRGSAVGRQEQPRQGFEAHQRRRAASARKMISDTLAILSWTGPAVDTTTAPRGTSTSRYRWRHSSRSAGVCSPFRAKWTAPDASSRTRTSGRGIKRPNTSRARFLAVGLRLGWMASTSRGWRSRRTMSPRHAAR